MNKRQKNTNGITLVSLVITIIIMLILAGVSINAAVGENGIVTRAAEASRQSKIAQEKEQLDYALANLNIGTIADDDEYTIPSIVDELVNKKNVLDSVKKTSAGQITMLIDGNTGEKYFLGYKGDNSYKIYRGSDGVLTSELVQSVSGGDITGYAVVTADDFNNAAEDENKGKFSIVDDADVVFMDEISGELSLYVQAGVHATVGIYANMTLTNSGLKRSAIDIEPTGELTMYIGEGVEVTVNSGFGEDASGITPGKGGYAGIHVPWKDTNGNGLRDDGEFATLRLKGYGTVIGIGGNAGNGGATGSGGDNGGAGGGGAGAGIGGNGGNGGSFRNGVGASGKEGENCGNVEINNNMVVYAYGGAGGSSGQSRSNLDDATGGGGYPGAGIGGGRRWWSRWNMLCWWRWIFRRST